MSETLKLTNDLKYAIPCIICGEAVELDDIESQQLHLPYKSLYKVCPACKEAVMRIRNIPEAEHDNGTPENRLL